MRNLWISRSNLPRTLSLSELLLSLATGIVLIIHYRFLGPVVAGQHCNIQSVMAFVILVSFLKCILLFRIFKEQPRGGQKQKQKQKSLSRRNLMYPGMARAGTYLSLIILVSGGRSTDMPIVVACTLIFICWLHFCSNDSTLAKTVKKGRNYSSSPIKVCLLYLLVLIAVALQPQEYSFAFELHFEIFIIFIASLLAFSYFYLHKAVLTFANRDKNYRLLAWESLFQFLALLVVWFYFFFMAQQMEIAAQFVFIKDNWWVAIILTILNTGYEMILWQHIRKVALTQLALTLATGFLWLNIYQIVTLQIQVRLYISVILMIAVLLVNVGLLSQYNLKKINNWLSDSKGKGMKKKKRKSKEHMFQEFE